MQMSCKLFVLISIAFAQYQYWPPQYAHVGSESEYQLVSRRPFNRRVVPVPTDGLGAAGSMDHQRSVSKSGTKTDYEALSKRVNEILGRSLFNLKKSEVNAGNLMLNDRSRDALNESVQALDQVPRSATGRIYQKIDGIAEPDQAGAIPASISKNLPLPGFAQDLPASEGNQSSTATETSLYGRILEHKRETPVDATVETAGRITQIKK